MSHGQPKELRSGTASQPRNLWTGTVGQSKRKLEIFIDTSGVYSLLPIIYNYISLENLKIKAVFYKRSGSYDQIWKCLLLITFIKCFFVNLEPIEFTSTD